MVGTAERERKREKRHGEFYSISCVFFAHFFTQKNARRMSFRALPRSKTRFFFSRKRRVVQRVKCSKVP